jgi:hypothetical protein
MEVELRKSNRLVKLNGINSYSELIKPKKIKIENDSDDFQTNGVGLYGQMKIKNFLQNRDGKSYSDL